MGEFDTLEKIMESEKLTKYEKLCVYYLIEMHIDKCVNGYEDDS